MRDSELRAWLGTIVHNQAALSRQIRGEMDDIDTQLADVKASVDAEGSAIADNADNLARLVADFEAQHGNGLSPDQLAAFGAIKQAVDAHAELVREATASIEGADPLAPAPEPSPTDAGSVTPEPSPDAPSTSSPVDTSATDDGSSAEGPAAVDGAMTGDPGTAGTPSDDATAHGIPTT